jgi:hypothetical protein
MKKILIAMVMMLVASVSYGQVEDLFNRADEYNARKAMQERIMRQKADSCRWIEICKDAVQKFANTLRQDGVDMTKLTDEDIDRLDSIRCNKKENFRCGSHYFYALDEEKLYTMPSEAFKKEMKKETRYYAKIKKYNVSPWEDGTITCDADSTVYIDRGYYNIDGVIGHSRWVYDGDTIKIRRATFVCISSDMKVYDWSSGKCVGDGKEGVVNLKVGIYMYRGREIVVKRGRNEYYNTVFNGIDNKKNKKKTYNDDMYF